MSKAKSKLSVEDFFTKPQGDAGQWLEITMPGDVEKSFELLVTDLGTYKFKSEMVKMNREEVARGEISDEQFDTPDEIERRHLAECKLLSALVIDWRGIDTEFTQDCIYNLLVNAPYVHDAVNRFAADKKNFTKKASKD